MKHIKNVWENAQWISPPTSIGEVCPSYSIDFSLEKTVNSAILYATAMGTYRGEINGHSLTDAVLMPGWTAYHARLQYQSYDLTKFLSKNNTLTLSVGRGWYRSRIAGGSELPDYERERLEATPPGLIAVLIITYADGTQLEIPTSTAWSVTSSMIQFSDIYDGEIADATADCVSFGTAAVFSGPDCALVPQSGLWIRPQERITPKAIFQTPKGETVIDFGQNLTGYVELQLDAKAGDRIALSHGEVLDSQGNFYTDNYRSAKAQLQYTCREGKQTYHPWFTFFGFRYIRVDSFPGTPAAENFAAIVVHSDMQQTGYIRSSDSLLNRLFENIRWGQKGNFLDIPTDCPQRDERLGWTGDAQAFIKTACYQYDVEQFFTKWLEDMALEQRPNGVIPHVIPAIPSFGSGSAAWADAATICPWQIYQFYGNRDILRKQYACMKGHLSYIASASTEPDLWVGDKHFGDWLGIDAPAGSYKGSSREDLIASAFYAHSTELVIKAGKVLGEDVSEYAALYSRIVARWREFYPVCTTQTELVLAIYFRLAEDLQAAADQLAQMVMAAGTQLQTGFVGTPYLLHVLSDYGYTDLAYDLLLRTQYPSWLYPVTQGATTVWEHWDGQKPDGSFWSADMNSFNHYAYGAVLDWVYEKAAGIQVVEDAPGFEKVRIAPQTGKRLEWLDARLETRHGSIHVYWCHLEGSIRYSITVPVSATLCIGGKEYELLPGRYEFFETANE